MDVKYSEAAEKSEGVGSTKNEMELKWSPETTEREKATWKRRLIAACPRIRKLWVRSLGITTSPESQAFELAGAKSLGAAHEGKQQQRRGSVLKTLETGLEKMVHGKR